MMAAASITNELVSGSDSQIGRMVILGILYAVAGVLFISFAVMIVTGTVKSYQNPERFGPRTGADGRPSQTRVQGIAKAVLDTLPKMKYKDADNSLKSKDVELGKTPERSESAGKPAGEA